MDGPMTGGPTTGGPTTGAQWVEWRRTCLAYSPGGHRAELDRALDGIRFMDAFHVTFASGRGANANERAYHLCHPRRSLWRTLRNAAQALRVLRRERPAFVITTGADVAMPVFVLGKLLGARTVFVETSGSLEPSLAGRLCYRFADLFIVTWPEKLLHFPRAQLASGPLL